MDNLLYKRQAQVTSQAGCDDHVGVPATYLIALHDPRGFPSEWKCVSVQAISGAIG